MPAKRDLLSLHRFNGTQTFTIGRAVYRAWRDREAKVTRLVFEVRAAKPVATLADTREADNLPHWELGWAGQGKASEIVRAKAKFSMPKGYDDETDEYLNAFYYFEHNTTEKNSIEVVSVGEKTVRARLQGYTTDPNFYDGSKPATRVEVLTTFTWNARVKALFG